MKDRIGKTVLKMCLNIFTSRVCFQFEASFLPIMHYLWHDHLLCKFLWKSPELLALKGVPGCYKKLRYLLAWTVTLTCYFSYLLDHAEIK